jgi:hypothetical protein
LLQATPQPSYHTAYPMGFFALKQQKLHR